MSEQQAGTESEHIAILIKALDGAESSLSETAAIELRRRLNTAGAIIRSVCPMFCEVLSLQHELDRRQSRVPLVLLIASLVVGGLLHYAFRDPGSAFDFTFGMFIAAYGFVGWLLHGLDTERKAQKLRESQRAVDEMLYRWIANGGHEDRFWELRDQVNVDAGAVDPGTETYQGWWHEMKGDLLDNIKGEPSGVGAWRPRFS